MNLEFDELSNKVIAAAIKVHKALGPGFLESIYEQALVLELKSTGMSVEFQKVIQISYRGQLIGKHVLDIVVDDSLILELKAISDFEDIHFAQLRSYLHATGIEVGLLMNFNKTKLSVRRVVKDFHKNEVIAV